MEVDERVVAVLIPGISERQSHVVDRVGVGMDACLFAFVGDEGAPDVS
jgi:hypothetical protein